MSGFAALQVTDAIGRVLEQQGFSVTDPYLAEIVPTAARGNNLVAVTPPAALHAMPGLAGAINALTARGDGLLLMLVPEAALDEWDQVTGAIARPSRLNVHAVRTLARAGRLLLAGSINILITPPAAALALVQRSVLKTDQITAVFMAWPELWADDESITPLMQDIGRDVQRIIYTSEPDRVSALVERHARRAHTVPPMMGELPSPAQDPGAKPAKPGQLHLVTVAWVRRNQAVQDVIELLDPAASSAWTLTRDPAFLPDLPSGTLLAGRELPAPGLIIAYDLPTTAQLAQLITLGDVVVLVPPSALTWARRVLPSARNLRLVGPADTAQRTVGARRDRIANAIENTATEPALLALAPLFQRYDAEPVAAALYELWQERAGVEPPPPPAAPGVQSEVLRSATARIWAGVGKKDGATPNDFVGVLTKELKYERAKIGKIEVRELYSLVEVPATDADTLVGKLNGVTIRRRRVTARLDRGGKVRSEKSER